MKSLKMLATYIIASFMMTIGLASAASIPFNFDKLSAFESGGSSSIQDDFINLSSSDYTRVDVNSIDMSLLYDLTFLGAEAAYTDKVFSLSNVSNSINNQTDNIGKTLTGIDLTNTVFTVNNSNIIDFAQHIRVYQLETDWALATNTWNGVSYSEYAGMSLEVGTYIIGFGDNFGDGDFDDLIFSANAVSAVSIPAAAWLFGTALIGIIGIRKRAMKK